MTAVNPTVKYSQMNSVPKLFSCSYADCWTEKHFSTEFGVLTPNHTHSHTLFWGCVSRWFGRAPAWHAGGQRFDPAYLHQNKSLASERKRGFLLCRSLCGVPPGSKKHPIRTAGAGLLPAADGVCLCCWGQVMPGPRRWWRSPFCTSRRSPWASGTDPLCRRQTC